MPGCPPYPHIGIFHHTIERLPHIINPAADMTGAKMLRRYLPFFAGQLQESASSSSI
jgi:hypothetical protein